MSASDPIQPVTPTRAEELLLDFLRDHDAPCPVCNYNLRALTKPICPECGHSLALTVSAAKLRIGWLLAAVAPGFFSGVAAFFVLIPTFGQLFGQGRVTRGFIMTASLDLFGWCSLAFAIFLARRFRKFIVQPRSRQRWQALTIWAVHISALALAMLCAFLFG